MLTFNKKTKIIIATTLSLIAVLFIINLILSSLPKDYDRATLENPEAISSYLSSNEIDDFRISLLSFLESYYIDKGSTIDDIQIRPDSVQSFKSTNSYGDYANISFLIDIDSLKQTFRIDYISDHTKRTSPRTEITCPKVSETKYPDSICKNTLTPNISASIKSYLPYETRLPSGEKILVKKLTYKSGPQLEIYLYSCDDKNPPVTAAESLVKTWVETIGDDRNYNYNVRTGYCEGDAI